MCTAAGPAILAAATLHAVTGAERATALADFDRALGKYPAAAQHHDEQRAIARRYAAQEHELSEHSRQATPSVEPIKV